MGAARVIFSTGSLYLYDLSYVFELASEIGYDGVEVMCDERYSSRDPVYLKRLSDQYKLPILALHTPFSHKVPGWHNQYDEVDRVKNTIKLAETLNAETIIVHLPRRYGWVTININGRLLRFPWRQPLNRMKNWIEKDLAEVQAKTKIRIAIENMPEAGLSNKTPQPIYWNEVDTWSRVHQWLTLDTTHWATKKIDPVEAYLAATDRVAHIHLSNYNGDEHQLPHKGNLKLNKFLKTLAENQFSGTVSLELNPFSLYYKDAAMVRRYMAESLKFCRDHLK
jgi:sugar phosphate isomerase/epimerase